MAEIRRRKVPSRRRRDGLIRCARDATSQNGEDGIIERIFRLLPPSSPGRGAPSPSSSEPASARRARRYCVDVGAWDGVHLSNTYSLLAASSETSTADDDVAGRTGCDGPSSSSDSEPWGGVLIEADPDKFESLRALHGPLGNVCVCEAVSCLEHSPRSLTSILRRHSPDLPSDFDFLCVDVDGIDYWLMHQILTDEGKRGGGGEADGGGGDGGNGITGDGGAPYRPKVICVEFNPTMPDDLVYIQPRDDGVRHGSSLSALVELAEKRGYVLVETTLFNAFFVDRPLYELYLREEVPDVTVEALHECTMTTDLYQLYDGTIKLSGCKRMLWHRMPLEEKRMQMIPEDKRTFPFAPSGGTASDREADRSILDAAVDMSAYCAPLNSDDAKDGTKKTRAECASDLLSQLKRDGFALVRGTGVSSELCRDALTSTGAFLNDADESVRRSCLTEDRARRGYSPMCTENFASLVGENGPNDLVRKFRVGPIVERAGEEGGGGESSSDDARNGDAESSGETLSSPLLRPNVWPDPDVWGEESSRSFRMSIESFYGESCRVAHEVVRAICDGLALAAATKTKTKTAAVNGDDTGGDSLEERVGVLSMKDSVEHTSILTLLGYRVGTRHKKKRGKSGEEYPLVAAHTDVGVITLLLFDAGNCASLQRAAGNKKEDGGAGPRSWEDVSLPRSVGSDPVFVVNVGDCMSELCDGELPSTLHRVVPRRGGSEPRNCLALFVGLDPGETVLLPSGERITYEEWRRRRIARATEVLKLKK